MFHNELCNVFGDKNNCRCCWRVSFPIFFFFFTVQYLKHKKNKDDRRNPSREERRRNADKKVKTLRYAEGQKSSVNLSLQLWPWRHLFYIIGYKSANMTLACCKVAQTQSWCTNLLWEPVGRTELLLWIVCRFTEYLQPWDDLNIKQNECGL